MRFVDELRDGEAARRIAARIAAEAPPGRRVALMEFCGGHTHTICRYGIAELLPPSIELIHGPGCPVCVLPIGRLDQAIDLARRPGVTLASYGDMLRVPGRSGQSLLSARTEGADVRVVYGPAEALRLARSMPERQIVFFAIGFETTTPPTALAVKQAAAEGLDNVTFLVNHVLTPPAIEALLADPTCRVEGIVGPGHVATVVGTAPFERFPRDFGRPIVVSGFEPLDLLLSIQLLVRQLRDGRAEVENQYGRAVRPEGNRVAQALVEEVFEVRERFAFRGLGPLPRAGLRLRAAFARFDAERRFGVAPSDAADHPACACGDVLRGKKRPEDCRVFATACTPDAPLGACMVSPEGACAAHFRHRRALPVVRPAGEARA